MEGIGLETPNSVCIQNALNLHKKLSHAPGTQRYTQEFSPHAVTGYVVKNTRVASALTGLQVLVMSDISIQ